MSVDYSVQKGSTAPMAQDADIYRNGPGRGNTVITDISAPYCLETAYGYQLDLDFLKYVEDIQSGSTIKRLNLKRRPRVADSVAEPQSGATPSQWTSSESLSSASSDDTRHSAMFSVSRGRPPLPPPHGTSSNSTTTSSHDGPSVSQKSQEGKPLPAVRSLTSPRYNALVEKTLMETRRRLEQEKTIPPQPEPHPRRRLASFGGVGSSGSLSPFTGWGAYNQNNNGNKPSAGELSLHMSSSLGSGGSGGSLRPSPQSSGRATPVTGLSPLHLQHIRDQMVVALQRLKEMEDQVKTIPVLQVKISVLQEEKRQLVSQMKNQNNNQDLSDMFRKRAHSTGSSEQFKKLSEDGKVGKTEDKIESALHSAASGLKEFRQLSAEMEALERTIKGGRLQARRGLTQNTLHDSAYKFVTEAIDEDLEAVLTRSSKHCRDVGVETKPIETRCIATGVSEAHLGVTFDGEVELETQQRIIEALKDRVCQLEAELKESTLQKEMGRLRLELQAAGARNRADKGSTARPSTNSTATEARPQTRSLGVGNHMEVQDACTGRRVEAEGCSVGVSCRPEQRSVSTGPDVPMIQWEVRKRVESRDQCVGRRLVTNTQCVGTEVKLCEAGVSTDVTMESLGKGGGKCRSVGCGDSPVNVIVGALKEMVSHGMVTDPVKGVDLGVMASPQTASQRTNTVLSSVSRFTNTRWAFNTNSSTNTVINTQEKHTNTPHTLTRTVAVGNSRVRDIQAVAKTRSVGVGTSTWAQAQPAVAKTTTRDTGVGLANINENYLVGLKTQNIACGPSCLPDPAKTRSIGVAVGEGRIRDDIRPFQTPAQTSQLSPQSQSQLEPGLDHYIEKMQRLLREQQCLLTESYSELGEVFIQPHTNLGTISTQLASTLSCINSAMKQGCAEGCSLTSESRVRGQSQSLSGLSRLIDNSPQSDSERSGVSQPVTKESEDKQKTLMEHQTSSSQHGKGQPTSANILRSIMKKQEGSSGTRKSLKFVGVNAGTLCAGCRFEPMSTSEPTSEEASSEEEEKNRNVNRKWREVCGLPDQGRTEPRRDKGVASRDWRGHMKAEIQERFKLSEKMLSACQALRTHLSDDKALPSRELRSCLNTLQHEWFRVSSQKSAVPAVVEDYLSAFRAVSPAVLQHVANMADGNGNTALHYSVSHSNFHVVKRMLGAEVCNVNQQNKAGYTPIMLAALAAVEAPEDMRVVEELFTKGDVNAKASQAGQTALMLAVSHGRMDMVKALLVQGAEVNLQDDEGSTALMCASEHGHAEIVRLLLAQPGCDATLSDSDESTALSVALEAGHKDIAVLLYAHVNFSKGQPGGGTPRLSSKSILSSSGKSVFE